MGIKTVITSDWNGKTITDPIEPVTITIKRPGQEAKDVTGVYMTDEDVDALMDTLKDDDSYLYREEPSPTLVRTKTLLNPNNSDRKAQRAALSDALETRLELTTKAEKDKERAWFAQNWKTTKESKEPITAELTRADPAKLKQIAQVTEDEKQILLDIVKAAPNLMNVGVIKIVRLLRGEEIPS